MEKYSFLNDIPPTPELSDRDVLVIGKFTVIDGKTRFIGHTVSAADLKKELIAGAVEDANLDFYVEQAKTHADSAAEDATTATEQADIATSAAGSIKNFQDEAVGALKKHDKEITQNKNQIEKNRLDITLASHAIEQKLGKNETAQRALIADQAVMSNTAQAVLDNGRPVDGGAIARNSHYASVYIRNNDQKQLADTINITFRSVFDVENILIRFTIADFDNASSVITSVVLRADAGDITGNAVCLGSGNIIKEINLYGGSKKNTVAVKLQRPANTFTHIDMVVSSVGAQALGSDLQITSGATPGGLVTNIPIES